MKLSIIIYFVLLLSIDVLASRHIVVSSSGEVGNGLALDVPLDEVILVNTLNSAHTYIKDYLSTNNITNEEIIIYVRGGVYYGTYIQWQVSSPLYETIIRAYPGEKPVFDGRELDVNDSIQENVRKGKFLHIAKSGITKITIQGLKVINYKNAITFNGVDSNWNGYNKIIGCVFDHIGTKYYDSGQDIGHSVIGLVNSRNNEIRENIFSYVENRADEQQSYIHAIYLQRNSSENTIENNYINLCSGDPIKLRDGSDNNIIVNNYTEFSGLNSFVLDKPETGEAISNGTTLDNNTILFPYPYPWSGYTNLQLPIKIYHNYDQPSTVSLLNNLIYGNHPKCGKVIDMTSGDTNSDGVDEVYAAINYSDISIIIKSQPTKELYFSKILLVDQTAEIGALIFDDFNNDGVGELITAKNLYAGGVQVVKGDGVSSITNHGTLYQTPFFQVSAFASGDFDQDGVKELITAFNNTENTQIHRGNGEWSIGNFGSLYSNTWWRTSAFTSGDFDQDGVDELITAFYGPGKAQIHRGNGKWSVGNFGILDNDSTSNWYNPRMTSSDFDNDGDIELITSFNNSENTQITRGNGEWSIGNFPQLYQSIYWRTSALTSGDFNGDGIKQLITAFVSSENVQVTVGNGEWSVGNQGTIYKSQFLNSECTQSQQVSRLRSTSKDDSNIEIETIKEDLIYLSPNPTSQNIVIQGIHSAMVRIFDMNGRLVLQIDNYKSGEEIDLTYLLKGSYLLRINKGDQLFLRKLIRN